jgi:hypothetical protein
MERIMFRYANRWTALFGWTALMAIVWTLFVPRGLSATTFTLLSVTTLLVMISGSALWRSQQPSPSVRQIRATLDSDESARTAAQSSA